MNPLQRFVLPDSGFNKALTALLSKPKVIVIAPVVESHPDRPPQELINNLEDEICNIAYDCSLSASISISYKAACRSCGEDWDVEIDDVSQFDASMSYCGKNQYCLP